MSMRSGRPRSGDYVLQFSQGTVSLKAYAFLPEITAALKTASTIELNIEHSVAGKTTTLSTTVIALNH